MRAIVIPVLLLALAVAGCGHYGGDTNTSRVAVTREETEVEGLLTSLASSDAANLTLDREIRLLAASDLKPLVHSIAPQIRDVERYLPRALAEFDSVYDVQGARAAGDALVAAVAARRQRELVGRDADFYWLSPSVVAVSEMFQKRGSLFGTLPLRRIDVTGQTAELTYRHSAEPPVILRLDLERGPAGDLRIVGIRGLRPEMLDQESPHL